jgi:hypothetical protein
MLSITELLEDTRAYYSDEYKVQIIKELYFNAYRTLKSVYIFRNFDEYIFQLKSDKNEEKTSIYWNTAYYEKLTDYIKISVAFENYNKAVLIENGYLVHKIQKSTKTKDYYFTQNSGNPVKIEEFKKTFSFTRKSRFEKYYLDGLQKNFPTIKYSQTLDDIYQDIICIDKNLLRRLIEINDKRNRLHFFTDFKGAFMVDSHIEEWTQIKELAINTIENKIKI